MTIYIVEIEDQNKLIPFLDHPENGRKKVR